MGDERGVKSSQSTMGQSTMGDERGVKSSQTCIMLCTYTARTSILEHCAVPSKRNNCRGKHTTGTAGEETPADDSAPPSLQFDEACFNKSGATVHVASHHSRVNSEHNREAVTRQSWFGDRYAPDHEKDT